MYLATVALYFIEAIVFQMSFTDFAVWEVETPSAQSVGLSYYTTVSAPATYDAHAKDDTPWYTILRVATRRSNSQVCKTYICCTIKRGYSTVAFLDRT